LAQENIQFGWYRSDSILNAIHAYIIFLNAYNVKSD